MIIYGFKKIVTMFIDVFTNFIISASMTFKCSNTIIIHIGAGSEKWFWAYT